MKAKMIQRQITIVALGGVLVFLLIVIVEHLINRSLDPARHEISEYVHTPLGWLITIGFLAWAASLAATGLLASYSPDGRAVCMALFAAAIGMVITACFATQTSAGRLPAGVSLSVSGRLHDIGSGLTTAALIAAALLSLRLRQRPTLRRATIALLAFALPADVLLAALVSHTIFAQNKTFWGILSICPRDDLPSWPSWQPTSSD